MRARELAAEFDAQMKQRGRMGGFADAEPSPMTLAEWVDVWWRRESVHWRSTAARVNRRQVFERWILPYLADVRLRDLGAVRVREFLAQVTRDGASANRVNVVKKELSACLGVAVRDGVIPSNPCAGIRKLAHRVTGHRAWPPIVFERIRARMAPRDALAVSLMYLAGLRPEEVMALTWGQVREQTLLIDRAAPDGVVQVTKTQTVGVVPIVEPLAHDLAAARPAGARDEDLVIRGREGDGVIGVRYWRSRVWVPAVARTRRRDRPRPYDCRHTFASLLIHEGLDVLKVSRYMRHAKPDITLRVYAHEFAEWDLRGKVPITDAVAEARAQVRLELVREAQHRLVDHRHRREALAWARRVGRAA